MAVFWETMQVRQMGELLRRQDLPGVSGGWNTLMEALHRYPSTTGHTPSQLSSCPRTPAVYYFACITAVCARCTSSEGLLAAMEEYLPSICNGNPEVNNQYCLKFADQERALDRCLDWVLQAATECSSETPLAALMEDLNACHLRIGGDRARNMSSGLQSLKTELSQWDSVCREMYHQLLRATNSTYRTIADRVEHGVKQLILAGAPGTGKTCAARQVAQQMGAGYELVQFHPSYDYTDFVEGLRPVERNGKATFVRLDGSFKSFCRRVAEENHPERLYFFLIDEINRADLSKVFGELMFCLEADKRGGNNRVQTQLWTLPAYVLDPDTREPQVLPREEDLFDAGFFVPENVILIGTMNDIDRSVESMDFAMLRRFERAEVTVTRELLLGAFQSGGFGRCLQERAGEAAERVASLNEVIRREGGRFGLNQHYFISQGQFANLPSDQKDGQDLQGLIQYVWSFRVQHLLEEYIRGEEEKKAAAFLTQCKDALLGGQTTEPDAG